MTYFTDKKNWTCSACTGSECQENDLGLKKENATFISQKEHPELSDTKERGPDAEAKSNSSKDSDNPIATVDCSVASDKMRDGCNANAISCSATSNNATEPSSIASQEASAASTKDTTNPEQVEGDKPGSEELPAVVSPSQEKTEPKKIERAPAASSSIQQSECKQTGNGNSEGTSFSLTHYFLEMTLNIMLFSLHDTEESASVLGFQTPPGYHFI